MTDARTVFDVLPEGATPLQADVRLVGAYKAFAAGRPSTDDCEIIMVDLASWSGYYNTTSLDADTNQLRQIEGRREVFARIVRMADMPLKELRLLQAAVLQEQQTRGD